LFWCLVRVCADGWHPFQWEDLTGCARTLSGIIHVENGAIPRPTPPRKARICFTWRTQGGCRPFQELSSLSNRAREKESNSGIYFHSDINSGKGPQLHLSKGYECSSNNRHARRKRPEALRDCRLDKSPVDETQWFRFRFRVENKRITIWVNDRQTVDYTEPEDVQRPLGFAGRLLDPSGRGHRVARTRSQSFYWFKDIRIRRLP